MKCILQMSEETDKLMNELGNTLKGKIQFFPAKHDNNEMTFKFGEKGYMLRILPFELPKVQAQALGTIFFLNEGARL